MCTATTTPRRQTRPLERQANHRALLCSLPPKASWSRHYPLSNHLWINTERISVNLEPLQRSKSLDEMARQHATTMADSCKVFLLRKSSSSTIETFQKETSMCGPSIVTLHKLIMASPIETSKAKTNILNPNIQNFGMGAVKGSDGQIYICQLFS